MYTNLKQGYNNVVAVGKLKRNDLEMSSHNNSQVIRGSITIESKLSENEINETRIKVYAFEGSKPYDNLKNALTLPDASNAIGDEFIPKVRVVASLDLNEYVNKKTQDITSYNECRGIFIYESSDDSREGVFAEVDTVITDIDSEKLHGYIVGYKNKIIELKNGVVIPEALSEQATELYKPGDTARLTIALYNKVELQDTVSFGFVAGGSQIVTDRQSYMELHGGIQAYDEGDPRKYSEDEIANIKERREQAINQLQAQISPTGGMGNTGFQMTNSDDIPF